MGGRTRSRIGMTALLGLLGLTPAGAAGQEELGGLSLEELMGLEVRTVSRAPTVSMQVPAAVHVITQEDIRRSGATTLPEVLRLAPGVQVARIDAGKWAVGTRGFADRLARSMLVLIDGRAVYSPLFAGTYWETQDVLLEDIERIEVVRGPGGTLWGSNAVNGIVSIVTKPAADTRGLLVAASAGTEDRVRAAARYGARVGDGVDLRVYLDGFDRESQQPTVGDPYDGWRLLHGGFRSDAVVGRGRMLTFQGDLYSGHLGELVRETSLAPPYRSVRTAETALSGGSFLARFQGALGERTDFEVQGWLEHTDRDEYPVSEARSTLDLELQMRRYGSRHRLVWGAGYRWTSADIDTAPTASLPGGSEDLVSAFVEDQVSLASDRVRLTLGLKLERNDYSGWELQPSGRLAWIPGPDHTVWGAVTRAVRRPSRVERQYGRTSVLDPSTPSFVRLRPNPDFAPERLTAFELGYRVQPVSRVYLNLAAFHNEWRDLLSTELVANPFEEPATEGPPRTVYPVSFRNGLDGTSNGAEAMLEIRPLRWWRWLAEYAYLRVRMTPEPGSTDLTEETWYEQGSPRHQVRFQTSFDLPGGLMLDWHLRHVSELEEHAVPSYTTSDVRLAWQVTPALELEAVGRNLHEEHHVEWAGDSGAPDVAIERSLYLGFTWAR